MKKFLFLLALLACIVPGLKAENTSFKIVSDPATLQDGDQIIIRGKGTNYFLSTTQNTNNRKAVDGESCISGDLVTFDTSSAGNTLGIQVITLVANGPDWNLKVGDDTYLYAASSSANHLKTATLTTAGKNAKAKISTIENSTALSVVFQGGNTRNNLKYNPNNGTQIFACYASGQTDVEIYKEFVPSAGELVGSVSFAADQDSYSGYVPEGTKISLSGDVDGASIYYTISEDPDVEPADPTNASTLYSAPLVMGWDAGQYWYLQVKAVLFKDGAYSPVSTRTFNLLQGTDNFNATGDFDVDVPFCMTGNTMVLYAKGSYNYVYDGTTTGLIYKSGLGLKAGDKLTPGYVLHKTIFKGLTEFVPESAITVESQDNTLPEPQNVDAVDVPIFIAFSQNAYWKINGVTFAEDTPGTYGKDFVGTAYDAQYDETVEINFHNQFTMGSMPAGEYDVTGFVSVYNNEPTFFPIDFSMPPVDLEVSDLLIPGVMGIQGADYADYTFAMGSGAVYSANCSNGKDIQIDNNDNKSGIVVTTTAGIVKEVNIVWNSASAVGRRLLVYGSNSPYESAADLYDPAKRGTLLQTLSYDGHVTDVTVEPSANYQYIGMRSDNGPIYLESVDMVWDVYVESAVLPFHPVFSPVGDTFVQAGSMVEFYSPLKDAKIYYTLGDMEADAAVPTVENGTLYTAPVEINEYTQIKAILAYDGRTSKPFEVAYYTCELEDLNMINDPDFAGVPFTYNATTTVIYAEGPYAYITDGVYNALIYKANGTNLEAGDIIKAGWAGKVELNHKLPQITILTAVVTDTKAEKAVEPIDIEAEDMEGFLKVNYVNAYLRLMSVKIAKAPAAGQKNFTATATYTYLDDDDAEQTATVTVNMVNQFGLETIPVGTYDVAGFVGRYDDNVQFYPTAFTEPIVPVDVTTIAEVEALQNNYPFNMKADLTVIFAYNASAPGVAVAPETGKSVYAYVWDGENIGLMCGEFEAAYLSVVKAGWSGLWVDGIMLCTTEPTVEKEAASVIPAPDTVTAATLAQCGEREYVMINKVDFAEATPATVTAFTGKQADAEVDFYNAFALPSIEAGCYNVVGFTALDGENTITILPVLFIEAETDGIESIEAENAEARYFNLQGIEIANPVAGQVYIRVANGQTAKVIK